jgi:hypothetical protein
VQPYRFQGESSQVVDIPARKLEVAAEGKRLHYVVQSDTGMYYHMAFHQDSGDWLLVKTVDRVTGIVKNWISEVKKQGIPSAQICIMELVFRTVFCN